MPLALFDLDDTLLKGDCSSLWHHYMVDQGLTDDPDFLKTDKALQDAYHAGLLDMESYMAFHLSPFKGKKWSQIQQMVEPFVDQVIEPIIYPQARQLLKDLKNDGYQIMIISASAEQLVDPIARRLGVEQQLSVLMEFEQGIHTGRTRDVMTFREGKVLRLQRWLEQHQATLAGSRFYSDSHNDLPLLEMVDVPVATNPDSQLTRHATARGWQQLNW
ncbi:HAD family hydrolase [Marinobacterium jannaschii]|uniref:HAD family hydrolase n=1 Tax=Marinobacterium jannaschii TaxID=64970 RepID=UPI0004835B56|nr:HAD family hydrolase [Marinobacterium jannaschii]